MKYLFIPIFLTGISGVLNAQPLSKYFYMNAGSLPSRSITTGESQSVTMVATQSSFKDIFIWNLNFYGQVHWAIKFDLYGGHPIRSGIFITMLEDSSYMMVTGVKYSGYFIPLLVKASGTGDFLWAKSYDYPGFEGELRSIKQISSNRILMTGYLESGSTYRTGWAILVDTSGNLISSRKYVYGSTGVEFFDGKAGFGDNIIISGTIEEKASLIILDSVLDVVDAHMYDIGNYSQGLSAVASASTGKYFMTGNVSFASNREGALFIIDSAGSLRGLVVFQGSGQEYLMDILPVENEGTIFMSGYTSTSDSSNDVLIIKTDTSGHLISQRTVGQSGAYNMGFKMTLDAKNFIWIGSYSQVGGTVPTAIRFSSYSQGLDVVCSQSINLNTSSPSVNDVPRAIQDSVITISVINRGAGQYIQPVTPYDLCTTGRDEENCEHPGYSWRGNMVQFETDSRWSIFDLKGSMIASGKSGSKLLKPGVYIIRVNGNATRHIVH